MVLFSIFLFTFQTTVIAQQDPVVFKATPTEIVEDHTRNLTVTCSVPSPRELHMENIISLSIYRRPHDDNAETVVGKVTSFSAPSLSDVTASKINGTIGKSLDETSTLTIVWERPSREQAGTYVCELGALGVFGHTKVYTSVVNVTMKHLYYFKSFVTAWSKALRGLNSTVWNLRRKNEALEQRNEELFQRVETLEKELSSLHVAIDRLNSSLLRESVNRAFLVEYVTNLTVALESSEKEHEKNLTMLNGVISKINQALVTTNAKHEHPQENFTKLLETMTTLNKTLQIVMLKLQHALVTTTITDTSTFPSPSITITSTTPRTSEKSGFPTTNAPTLTAVESQQINVCIQMSQTCLPNLTISALVSHCWTQPDCKKLVYDSNSHTLLYPTLAECKACMPLVNSSAGGRLGVSSPQELILHSTGKIRNCYADEKCRRFLVASGGLFYSNIGCFPPSSVVHTEEGLTKPMRDLLVGDKVLSLSRDGHLVYSDVFMFQHRDHAYTASYFTFKTVGGESITLSPEHLLYVLDTNFSTSTPTFTQVKLAQDIQVGDIISVIDRHASDNLFSLRAEVVTSKEAYFEKGVYAPVTLEGTIVVDDVVASCYVFHEDVECTASLLYPIAVLYKVQKLLYSWFAWDLKTEDCQTDGIHWYANLLMTLAPYIESLRQSGSFLIHLFHELLLVSPAS